MTSIVNFRENLKDRTSNVLLEKLNRLYDAKISGVISPDELSKSIVLASELYANKISKGEVSITDINETKSFLPGFINPNYDGYFKLRHKDVDVASKIFIDETETALEKLEQRNKYSSPLFDEETYARGFKKL